MRKYLAVLLATVLMLSASCLVPVAFAENDTPITVTDMLGREVQVPANIARVACIGAGALRLYSYVGDMGLLCGVESCEYGFLISARPYQIVNADLFASLPSVGAGGPQGSADAESLVVADPDVIFSLYTSDVSAMDELQEATGIPVIVLTYGDTEAFDQDILDSVMLMGSVLGREARAAEVVNYITSITEDLDSRTASIPGEEKQTVYIGCQSNYGTHGIESSTANYVLFDAVHAQNVLDLNGYQGYQSSIDMETLLTLDPAVIILDAGGLSLLREQYAENTAVFDSLTAFQTGQVYVQMPYNAYYTNLEIAYADAYYIGTVLFPDAFSDIDIAEKFDEISTFLLGSGCYEQVVESVGGGYRQLDIDAELR